MMDIGDTIYCSHNTAIRGTLQKVNRYLCMAVAHPSWDEPVMVTTYYRIEAMDDRWVCIVRDPFRTDRTPIKKPRGRYVWKQGAWKRDRSPVPRRKEEE